MKLYLHLILVAFILAFTTAANGASVVTIDFTDPAFQSTSLQVVPGWLNLAISGYELKTFDNPAVQPDPKIVTPIFGSNGLGARSNNDHSDEIDGKIRPEGIKLEFDYVAAAYTDVTLLSGMFNNATDNDDLRLWIDNGPSQQTWSFKTSGPQPFDFDADGAIFTFSQEEGDGNDRGSNDNYYIKSLTIEYVPEPGTYALVGLGLLGLTMMRRRRSTK